MTDYTRGKIWGSGAKLTAADLNEEFDRIQAVINGGLEQSNLQDGEIEKPAIINAGADRFQTGGLERAERVAAAISEAAGSDVKVVLIPRALWGYVEDSTYSQGMFDTSILLVREGQRHPGHSVIAYGAKPDDSTVNDTPAFDAADAGAAAAAFASNPGAPLVLATVPGEYQLDSTPADTDGVGFIVYAGVTFAGTGDAPEHGFAGIWSAMQESTVDLGTVSAGDTVEANFNPSFDPAKWAYFYVEVVVDEDAGTNVTRMTIPPHALFEFTTSGNIQINSDRWAEASAGGFWTSVFNVNNNDSVDHDVKLTFEGYFLRKV